MILYIGCDISVNINDNKLQVYQSTKCTVSPLHDLFIKKIKRKKTTVVELWQGFIPLELYDKIVSGRKEPGQTCRFTSLGKKQ